MDAHVAEHERLSSEAQALGANWLDAHVRGHAAVKGKIDAALAENNQARKRVERKMHRDAKRAAKAATSAP